MQALLKKKIFIIFWVLVFLDIVGLCFDVNMLHVFIKPLLMPVLMLALLLLTSKTNGRKKIITALLFSFMGDVILLYQELDPLFFMLGLFFFLLTHIFYIVYFLHLNKSGSSPVKKHPYLIILIAVYAISLLYFLMPGLGDLKIPVTIYAFIISAMVFFSFYVPYRISKITRRLFITGAISFVVSDSLLALNKFYKPFPFASALIMLTYCLAQYLIIKGFVRNRY